VPIKYHESRFLRANARTQILIVVGLLAVLGILLVIKMTQGRKEGTTAALRPVVTPSVPATSLAPSVAPKGKVCAAATLLPDSTYVLVTLPDLKSAPEQFKASALSEIANDPAMKDALVRVYDALDDFRARMQMQYELTLSDFLNGLRGQCALALVPSEESGRFPDVVVIADAPGQGDMLRSFMDNVLKRWVLSSVAPSVPLLGRLAPKTPRAARDQTQPASTKSYTFSGVEIAVGALSGVPFYSASFGDTCLLTSSKKAIEGAITRFQGGAGSLASAALYKRLRAKLGAQKDLLAAYVNIEALVTASQGALTRPVLDLLDRAGLKKATALAYFAWVEGSGVKERLYVEAPAPRSGLMGVLSQPAPKRELLKYVPNTALWCADLGLDPSAFWTSLCTLTGSGSAGSLAKFEKDNGLDVLAELCPSLGNELLVYEDQPAFTDGRVLPNLVLIFKTSDSPKTAESLEKILKAVGASWPAPPPAETPAEQPPKPAGAPPAAKVAKAPPAPAKEAMFFSDVPHRTHVIRVLTPPQKSPAPNLALVVDKAYILLARNPDSAGDALDVIDGLRPALCSAPEFTDVLRRASSAAGGAEALRAPGGLLYYNTRQNLDVMQRLARDITQDLTKDLAIPIDYARLPLTEPVGQRMFGAAAVLRTDQAGLTIEAYSLAGLPATLALTGFEYTTALPPSYDPTSIALRVIVANNLARIGAAMRKYATDHAGSFPPPMRQASELAAAGYLTDLRVFYIPSSNIDFASFPDNMDFQFTSLPLTLTGDPKTIVAWIRRPDAAGGRTVLMLDGSVGWLPEQDFVKKMQ